MSRSCKECAHHNPDFIDEVCLHCSWPLFAGEPSNFKQKPVTNADRIRAMTDEELAGYLSHIDSPYRMGYARKDERDWLDWLKQEVSE